MMIYGVIMAGGSGTRFWPKSRNVYPKQFLNLFGNRTMLQQTADRLGGIIEEDKLMVVTNNSYVDLVKKQLPGAIEEFVVGEPVARNTAPCIAAAAGLLHKKDPDSVMVVLPADHHIGKPEEFREVLGSAIDTARREGSLVTIGIQPDRPETGYGYIRFDKERKTGSENRAGYRVKNFTEKPDLKTAESFLDSGDYLWNSGMFIWKTESILEAFSKYQPGIFEQTGKLIRSGGTVEDINRFYHACPSISVDYGIMEKAEKVHVVPGDFMWNDVGSWTAFYDLSEKDENGNALNGSKNVCIQDSASNLVQSSGGKIIALAGVEHIGVIETDDAILIVNLEKSQTVKGVVDQIKMDPDKNRYL